MAKQAGIDEAGLERFRRLCRTGFLTAWILTGLMFYCKSHVIVFAAIVHTVPQERALHIPPHS